MSNNFDFEHFMRSFSGAHLARDGMDVDLVPDAEDIATCGVGTINELMAMAYDAAFREGFLAGYKARHNLGYVK